LQIRFSKKDIKNPLVNKNIYIETCTLTVTDKGSIKNHLAQTHAIDLSE